MSSDLRDRPDRIAAGDWWLVQPHARRLVTLLGLAIIIVLSAVLIAIRPDPADAGGAGGGGQVRGHVRVSEAVSQMRAADSSPRPG